MLMKQIAPINKLCTLAARLLQSATGLRLSFMQFVHNFIRIASPDNTSSKRAMMVQLCKTHANRSTLR
ncbi:MAG: hypothetical protein CO065_17535 [Comamonadaceae bacterium CG_4_9_14_0_8_um_filter_57_21]|nr:MAG: hypothetical protein CO065_17535 [Comamonadaceae bacterium CG_4_9_14_0_8_um_filter_57_21]